MTDDSAIPVADESESRSSKKPIVLVVSVVAAIAIVYLTPLNDWLHFERWEHFADDARKLGPLGALMFAGATLAGVTLGAPRLLFAGLGGYLFGFWPGFLAAQIGTLFASILTFLYGRALGRDWVARKVGARFQKLASVLEHVGRHGIMTNLLIRNIPVGNSLLMTLAMSVTGMPLLDFSIGVFLGTAPEAAICAYLGNPKGAGLGMRIGIAVAFIVVLATVSYFGLRKTRLAKALRDANS